jgi:pyruvate dehydrogenase E2 component (dihydrolipoamide acetyltransferase)
MAEVQMPQLGESVTEGTITKWFKQVGDEVAEDEVLFEVSTDKVDSEVPSPVSGTLTEIRVPEGETVDVGVVLAVVGDAPAGDASASDAAAAEASGADESPAPAEQPAAEQVAAPEPEPAPSAAPSPAPAAAAPPAAGASAATAGRLMSPVVRQLVTDYGLDVEQITPTGAGGRITRPDVEKAIRAAESAGAQAPAAAAAPQAYAPPTAAPTRSAPRAERPKPTPRAGTGDTVESLNNMRRLTAEHMVKSKTTSPHAYTIVEVDYEGVERVRARHREAWRQSEGFSLTYLPFIARAVIDALRDFPRINATVGQDELIVHNYVNLAFAVDLNFEGLLAPVIHEADDKRFRAVARSIDDLAERARSKKLSVSDITGGTFTISNSGSFGTHLVLPIINQPQVGILSTDGISRKPVVVTAADGSEAIAIHSVGLLAMSWDHRAFDGAYAAAFVREVKEIIETRDWEAEL